MGASSAILHNEVLSWEWKIYAPVWARGKSTCIEKMFCFLLGEWKMELLVWSAWSATEQNVFAVREEQDPLEEEEQVGVVNNSALVDSTSALCSCCPTSLRSYGPVWCKVQGLWSTCSWYTKWRRIRQVFVSWIEWWLGVDQQTPDYSIDVNLLFIPQIWTLHLVAWDHSVPWQF